MKKLILLAVFIFASCQDNISGDLRHFNVINEGKLLEVGQIGTGQRITAKNDTLTAYSQVYSDGSIRVAIEEVIEFSTYTQVIAKEYNDKKENTTFAHSQYFQEIYVQKLKLPIIFVFK